MKISANGLGLIQAHEGLRLEAYPDPGSGGEPWTIGFGHTKGVKPGDVITEEEATTFLQQDIAWVEDCINQTVDVELTQNQFDALASFVFNLGCGAFKGSTLCRLLNAGNYAGAAEQFHRWTKAAGKDLPGLVKRRAHEAELFSLKEGA